MHLLFWVYKAIWTKRAPRVYILHIYLRRLSISSIIRLVNSLHLYKLFSIGSTHNYICSVFVKNWVGGNGYMVLGYDKKSVNIYTKTHKCTQLLKIILLYLIALELICLFDSYNRLVRTMKQYYNIFVVIITATNWYEIFKNMY